MLNERHYEIVREGLDVAKFDVASRLGLTAEDGFALLCALSDKDSMDVTASAVHDAAHAACWTDDVRQAVLAALLRNH